MLLDGTTLQRAVTSESISGIEFQLQNFGEEGTFEAANLARKVVLEDTHRCISMALHIRLKIFNCPCHLEGASSGNYGKGPEVPFLATVIDCPDVMIPSPETTVVLFKEEK